VEVRSTWFALCAAVCFVRFPAGVDCSSSLSPVPFVPLSFARRPFASPKGTTGRRTGNWQGGTARHIPSSLASWHKEGSTQQL
jgi:hypothetical protein